jgi:endo-1,4-beta-xylanase
VGSFGALALFLEACGPAPAPSPPGRTGPLATPGVPTTLPSASPIPPLDGDQLRAAVAALPGTGTPAIPGGGSLAVADLQAAAAALAAPDGSGPSPGLNPVAALGYILATADWSGASGAVELGRLFPGLALPIVRLPLARLPDGGPTAVIAGALPTGLTVRAGAALLVVSRLADGSCLVAIDDPARPIEGHPRLELGVLSAAALAPLLALAGARLDAVSGAVVLANGTAVTLRPMTASLASRLTAAAGLLFVDRVPLQPKGAKTPVLTLDPIVPAPPTSVAAQIRSIGQVSDGRVLGSDASGTAVARARYRPWRPDWEWVTTPDEVADYTVRELADAMGITFASFAVGAELTNPDLVRTWEKVANTFISGDALNMTPDGVFGAWKQADWAAMLARWPDVSAAFAAHHVPDGFNLDWSGAEQDLRFARSEGVRFVQAGMLLMGFTGMLPAIYNGGFSNDQLHKILEFMVKIRVLKYAGQVQEWIAVSEASACLLWGGPEQRFWYDRLGTEIIDQVFFWAHEADPKARLAFCEDTILDLDTDAARANTDKFMEFLRHFKAAGVPVDKAVLENNLWIYAPPSKASMVASLRSIMALGYGIGAAETTVSISDQYHPWAGRPRSVASVADPLQAQADLYRDLLEAYLEVGGEFGIWSPADPYSWLKAIGRPDTKALLLDDDFQPKPAYFVVRDVLKKRAGLT